MYVEALKMTDEGVQATKDAERGGVFIRPLTFVLGDYVGAAPASAPMSILGNKVYEGKLDFIEVLGKNSVRFTFSLPQNAPEGVTFCTVGEAMIYLDDGKTFGYAHFKEPQLKTVSYGLRFSLIVHTEVNIGQVIDVLDAGRFSTLGTQGIEECSDIVTSMTCPIFTSVCTIRLNRRP
jgi:hypothetical protein